MTEQGSDRAEAARRWWRALQPYRSDGTANPTGDRAALARLRRADVRDVLADEAVIDLYRRLGFGRHLADHMLPWVAAAATVLAHVREDERRRSPARAVGRATFEDKDFETAAMKPLRFGRLLAAREADEVAREMRRLVQLAEGKLDVGVLAAAILAWSHPEWGDRIRTGWAYDYFAAGDAAPKTNSSMAPSAPVPSAEAHP